MAGFTTDKVKAILMEAIKSTHYIGLATSEPADTGVSPVEPATATGYQRVTLGQLEYEEKPKQVANKEYRFIFECIEDAGTATHVILSAYEGRGKDFYFSAPLTTPLPLQKGYVPLIRPYKLKIAMDKDEILPYEKEKLDYDD